MPLDHATVMTARTKQTMMTAMATFPAAWLVLLYLFILRARFHFGHWPSASDGMAKYMGFPLHQGLTVYALLAAPWVAVGVVVAVIVLRRRDSGFRLGPPLATLAASVLVSVALFATDPGGFILWFVD